MLNKKDLRELIETTILDVKLTGAVVEKDHYAAQIIHALSDFFTLAQDIVINDAQLVKKSHRLSPAYANWCIERIRLSCRYYN